MNCCSANVCFSAATFRLLLRNTFLAFCALTIYILCAIKVLGKGQHDTYQAFHKYKMLSVSYSATALAI